MKNKIAIASAFIAASSFSTAEIVVNDFLSFEGFVDMSYSHTDTDVDSFGNNNLDRSDNSFQIDQVEISWLFDFDPVTAQIDLEYEDTDGDGDTEVEQAFVTYHLGNGGAITAGRYASMLGFEAFEPTGLYQYSYSYDIQSGTSAFGGTTDLTIIPGYAQGVKYTHEGDNTFFGISIQDEAFDFDGDRLGGAGDSSWAVEAAAAYYMENGLTFFLGGAYEDGEDNDGNQDGDTYVVNAYTTFETGAWIFAAEINYGETETGRFAYGSAEQESTQGLLMANFAYSDQGSVTGRFSYVDIENTNTGSEQESEFFKYTLAHGWAFTDNLSLITEVSYVDGELTSGGGDRDYESLLGAVELLFVF